MTFPEKIKQIFVQGWFKIIHSKNLQKDFLKIQDDVLDCYAEDQKEIKKELEACREILRDNVPYLNELSRLQTKEKERKQKLQDLFKEIMKDVDDISSGLLDMDEDDYQEWVKEKQKKFEALLK